MTRYESQYVSCGFPCRREACRYYKVLECDCCHEEVDRLYRFDDDELCENCVLVRLEVVKCKDCQLMVDFEPDFLSGIIYMLNTE